MRTRGRLAALAGVAFFVLGLVGTLIVSDDPGFAADPTRIAAFYEGEDSAILLSSTLYLVGVVFLLWFAGHLRGVLRRAEGGEGGLAATAFGGLVAGAAMLLGAAAVNAVGALRVQERGQIDPETATALFDVSSIMFGLAAPMAFAATVLASAVVALRTRALPLWLGAVSIPLGLALLIPPISWLAAIGFTFWVLVTGVVLALAEPATSQSDQSPTAGAPAPVRS